MATSLTIRNSNELKKLLICPVSGEKMTECVRLQPCDCRIQEKIAKQIFEGYRVPCYCCGKEVESYVQDERFRQMASAPIERFYEIFNHEHIQGSRGLRARSEKSQSSIPIDSRFLPGTFDNYITRGFRESRLVMVEEENI